MNVNYVGKTIPPDTTFSDQNFIDIDFSKSDLSNVIFKNVNFENCIFNQTKLNRTRFWCCFFNNCTFTRTDLSQTYIGAWGGGQSNCKFTKCKIATLTDASYLIDTVFNQCKIKGVELRSLYIKNVQFIGILDDFRIRKFNTSDIAQYQTPERTTEVHHIIQKKTGISFRRSGETESELVIIHNLDLSQARLQFVDVSRCKITQMHVANDGKHLWITKNLEQIAQQVYVDIETNWQDESSKSWALSCTKGFLRASFGLVCYYDFKHFENDDFAEKLMALFHYYYQKNDI